MNATLHVWPPTHGHSSAALGRGLVAEVVELHQGLDHDVE